MAQHKWAKEIHAWADGAEIEFKVGGEGEWMLLKGTPYWECKSDLFRIKPQPKEPTHVVQFTDEQLEQIQKAIKYASDNPITQPKEPQYLYVYVDDDYKFATIKLQNVDWQYVGKIKLEVEE